MINHYHTPLGWAKLCYPKDYGVLGFKQFYRVNEPIEINWHRNWSPIHSCQKLWDCVCCLEVFPNTIFKNKIYYLFLFF